MTKQGPRRPGATFSGRRLDGCSSPDTPGSKPVAGGGTRRCPGRGVRRPRRYRPDAWRRARPGCGAGPPTRHPGGRVAVDHGRPGVHHAVHARRAPLTRSSLAGRGHTMRRLRVRRRVAGSILIGVGAMGLVLSALLLVYPAWAEWQAHLDQGTRPAEVLPERLAIGPEDPPIPKETAEPVTAVDERTPDGASLLAETTPPGPPSA